jgi:FkbM family methyltransferase
MLKSVRDKIKKVPFIGPFMYMLYLKAIYKDGRVVEIQQGQLKGFKLHKFVRTVHDSFASGDYEIELQDALAKDLKPGQTFYDVGANAGFFTLLGAKLVGGQGKVVAYEPHPMTAGQIRKQLKLNHVSCAKVIVKAVADQEGEAEFTDDISSDMLGLASLRDGKAAATIRVQLTDLDCEVATHGIPDLIKIDIEGAEVMALKGMQDLLSNHSPVIYLELHGEDLAVECGEILSGHGYQFELLTGEKVEDLREHRFVIVRK